jgi:hypothetical protein
MGITVATIFAKAMVWQVAVIMAEPYIFDPTQGPGFPNSNNFSDV